MKKIQLIVMSCIASLLVLSTGFVMKTTMSSELESECIEALSRGEDQYFNAKTYYNASLGMDCCTAAFLRHCSAGHFC